MPESAKPVAKETFQFIGLASGRCDLPHRERSQGSRIADLASDIQSGHQILQILGIAEVVRINSDGIVRVGPRQVDGATAVGAHAKN